MDFFQILLVALALAADAFSVGAVLALRYRRARQVFRVAFHFGLFQALFPLVGAILGGALLVHVERFDHWVAFGLLALVGGRMIWSGLHQASERTTSVDLTRGWSLVGLSVAVSIDALAVGITLPATGTPVGLAVTSFGVVAGFATLVAMCFVAPFARRLGGRIEVAAGLVLVALGLKILQDHMGFLPLG